MHFSTIVPILAFLGAAAAQYLAHEPYQRRAYYEDEDMDLGSLYARSNYDGDFEDLLDAYLARREAKTRIVDGAKAPGLNSPPVHRAPGTLPNKKVSFGPVGGQPSLLNLANGN